ncbi:hypothetical protein DFH09DRAFT_1100832 [Mycena vulgaris]|nr:hypothetical protein DFH09DRAFT_1100832 [Mycena vulgaris]
MWPVLAKVEVHKVVLYGIWCDAIVKTVFHGQPADKWMKRWMKNFNGQNSRMAVKVAEKQNYRPLAGGRTSSFRPSENTVLAGISLYRAKILLRSPQLPPSPLLSDVLRASPLIHRRRRRTVVEPARARTPCREAVHAAPVGAHLLRASHHAHRTHAASSDDRVERGRAVACTVNSRCSGENQAMNKTMQGDHDAPCLLLIVDSHEIGEAHRSPARATRRARTTRARRDGDGEGETIARGTEEWWLQWMQGTKGGGEVHTRKLVLRAPYPLRAHIRREEDNLAAQTNISYAQDNLRNRSHTLWRRHPRLRAKRG